MYLTDINITSHLQLEYITTNNLHYPAPIVTTADATTTNTINQ